MKTTMSALTLTIALAMTPATTFAVTAASMAGAEAGDPAYARGSEALDDERWNDAIAAFQESAKSGERADAAHYWLAYAQQKAGRAADALSTIQTLRQKHPKSKWNDDAKVLELEIRQSSGQAVAPEKLGDDELKLLAITSLMHSDQDRAVTLLDKILRANNSDEVKERALFVLGQSSSQRAQQLIESIARGSLGRELQQHALQSIGISNMPKKRELLAAVYRSATDRDTKSAALEGMMLSNDKASVVSIATTEKDLEMRAEAVRMLGVMKGIAELNRLYGSEQSTDVKNVIIEAFFVAGDVARLTQIIRTEKQLEPRLTAIRHLGAMGRERSEAVLVQLWNSESNGEIKEAVLEGLFISNNSKVLIDLARKEKNKALKRDIVEKLSVMPTADARAYMLELLEQ